MGASLYPLTAVNAKMVAPLSEHKFTSDNTNLIAGKSLSYKFFQVLCGQNLKIKKILSFYRNDSGQY